MFTSINRPDFRGGAVEHGKPEMRNTLLAAVLIVTGCSGGQKAKDYETILAAEQLVKARLRDPQSADFSNTFVIRPGSKTVCGHVNARNGFGGMSGRMRFLVLDGILLIEDRSDPEAIRQLNFYWDQICV